MKETEKIIQDFVERLRMTREYKLYEYSKERVRMYPGLWEQINEYRRKRYLLQKSEEDLFDRLDAFDKEYEEFRSNPPVETYLEAEAAVCKMIREIYEQIASVIELDIYPEL